MALCRISDAYADNLFFANINHQHQIFSPMKTVCTLFIFCLLCSNAILAQLDSIYDQGNFRTYRIHIPTGYSANKQYPIVLNLHGLKSNAILHQALTQFNTVADSLGFIVVYPNAREIANNRIWAANVDTLFLSNLVDSIRQNYATNNCLFVMGMSQGGNLTYKFATTTKHIVTAIAIGSGNMYTEFQNASTLTQPIPLMHFHGTDDTTVDYNGEIFYFPPVDSTIEWWVQHNNCTTTPVVTTLPNIDLTDSSTVEKYYYGGGTNGSEVTFYKILNGGHTWSGAFPTSILGNTNQDIHQSTLIGDFFHGFCSPLTNITEVQEEPYFKLFPNPFDQYLRVTNTFSSATILDLYDQLGRRVFNVRLNNAEFINTAHLSKGIYFYVLKKETKQIATGKLLKN